MTDRNEDTSTSSPGPESIDALITQLKARVAERRRAGEYPPGLEEELDAHFERIAAHRFPAFDYESLRAKLTALDAAGAFDARAISYETRLPAGSLLHRLLGKLVRRQTEGILAQAQRHADAVREVLWGLLSAIESPAAHSHVDLVGGIETIFEKLAVYERSSSGTPALAALAKRVDALEAEARDGFRPWYSNERFEASFRGNSDDLRDRYRDLADLFVGVHGPVIDVGCGRGEFLELLLERGVDARGIEIDPELVQAGISQGLPVEYGEAVSWLNLAPEGGLSGLVLIQVVEHLHAQALVDFVALASRKLRPGGRVVIETVNPQSLYTFAHAFYLDPTHHAPVHPAYLMFLLREAAFSQVDVQWRSPCPEEDQLQAIDVGDIGGTGDTGATTGPAHEAVHSLVKQANANSERVNQLLFAPQDYAVVAVR